MGIALGLPNPGGTIQKLKSIQDEIIGRVDVGKCTMEDALALYNSPPHLFALADMLRKKAVGDVVTYVINRNINFTNRCVGTCKFCAFRKDDGFILSIPEILDKIRDAENINATEVCMQGGLLPDWDINNYCEILEAIKQDFPYLHIHAFSPMEVFHAAHNSNINIKETLSQLKRSGLDSMPGTAAEILSDRVREEICPDKLTTHEWIDVVRTAHRTGIPTTSTMMYGHIETLEERIDHMFIIREIQKKTGGFTEFVPLPFMHLNNRLGESDSVLHEHEDMKMHALARVILYPYIRNIQVSWVKLGPKMAQSALNFGANDLGGTLMEENISKSAGASNGEYMAPEEFKSLISGIDRIPRQRDTFYQPINLSNSQRFLFPE
jgi:FO synthase subunit 2